MMSQVSMGNTEQDLRDIAFGASDKLICMEIDTWYMESK